MNKYVITARRTALCQAGEKVQKMIEGGSSSFKTVLNPEKTAGGYQLHIDEQSEDWSNVFAVVKSIKDETGAELDETDIKVIATQDYTVKEFKYSGASLTATLVINQDTNVTGTASDSDNHEAIMTIINEKVAEGIVTKEEAEERLKYMDENHVDDFLIERVVRGWKKYPKKVHKPSCIYVDPYLADSQKKRVEGIVSEGLRHGVSRIACILEGDKSVGKNVYAETMTWLLGMPMYLITFSRQMSPSSVYGEKSTDNSAAEALKAFDPDILKKAEDLKSKRDFMIQHFAKMNLPGNGEEQIHAINTMMEQILTPAENELLKKAEEFKMLQAQAASVNIVIDQSELYDWLTMGGVMVFNEMNMAEANFFASFTNQLLDGTGFLFIPGRGEVKINPDCVLIGTQNADYEGVEQQNEATMSRFNALCFKQPETIKGQLVAAVTAALKRDGFDGIKVNPEYFKQAENYYKQCSSSVKKDIVSNACLNIRGFVRAITLVAESNGITRLKRAIEMAVINTCPVDERQDLYATLDAIVSV